jgi:hypothetical protein
MTARHPTTAMDASAARNRAGRVAGESDVTGNDPNSGKPIGNV